MSDISEPKPIVADEVEYAHTKEHHSGVPASGLERATDHEEVNEETTIVQRTRHMFREPLAEFMGTMILVMYGDGVVAQKMLSDGAAGNYTTIAFLWAAAVMLGYMTSGGISGGHLNPAVTISAAVYREFPWKKVPGYIFAQLFGGFIGALLVYGTYVQSINHFAGQGVREVIGDTATAGIFCTFPQEFLNTKGQFASELVATALLQFGIFALTDPFNAPLGSAFPFGLFVLIYALGLSFGYQTGYALNMARDMAPRVAAVAVGYGSEMFTAYDNYSWVPVIAPVIGAVLGGGLYDLFIYQGTDLPLNKPGFGFGKSRSASRV